MPYAPSSWTPSERGPSRSTGWPARTTPAVADEPVSAGSPATQRPVAFAEAEPSRSSSTVGTGRRSTVTGPKTGTGTVTGATASTAPAPGVGMSPAGSPSVTSLTLAEACEGDAVRADSPPADAPLASGDEASSDEPGRQDAPPAVAGSAGA
jgi:hypothetical protein